MVSYFSLLGRDVVINLLPSVLTVGQDHGHHLVGVSALYNSSNCAITSGLGQAAFWQFVRQDVYMSLSKAVPPRTDVAVRASIERTVEHSDSGWANQIVWITLCILTFCFGDQPQSLSRWGDLSKRVSTWVRSKPGSFDPVYFRDRLPDEGSHFPEMWLSDSWHGKTSYHWFRPWLTVSSHNSDRNAILSPCKTNACTT